MTESEAIEKLNMLNDALNWQRADADESSEALQMAINAIEKQIPKKPTPIDYKKYMDVVNNAIYLRGGFWCPNCKHVVRSGTYCNDCGQKLDWERDTD